MVNFGKKVVKYRVLILILGVLLLIPSVFGYLNTRVNYDVLTYLPDNIETMKGQDILVNDFGTGAFSMFIVDGMEEKDVAELKEKIEDEKARAKEIEELEEYVGTDEYVEDVAKEKLGLVHENEIIFKAE